MALITVQIVTFNSAATIEFCLDSVQSQRGVSHQVVVVDNASQDCTVEKVQAFAVPIIQNTRNYGYGTAHNQALACGDSPYVLTLNPDIWLTPDFLLHIVEAVDRDERIGSAAGCLLRADRPGGAPYQVDSAGLYMRRNRRQGLRGEGLPLERRPRQALEIFGPDGAAAFYRRAMLEDIAVSGEVFDDDFFLQKEDIDICWRARLRGWSSVYAPDAVAHHIRTFRPGQRRQVAPELRYYGVRNRYLLMLKNDSAPHLMRDLWAVGLYDIAILLYILLVERESLRALAAVFAVRHRTLAKRRAIQTRRTVDWQQMRLWFNGE